MPKETTEAEPVPEDRDDEHDDNILAPCKMRRRRNGAQGQETYLIHGPQYKYIITISAHMSEHHEEVAQAALAEVKNQRIKTKTALRSFVKEEIAHRNEAGDIDMH